MAKGKAETPTVQIESPQSPQLEEAVTLESLSKEQLIGVIETLSVEIEELKNSKQTFLVNPTDYDEDKMIKIRNSDEYTQGVNIASKLVGIYDTLSNFGFSLESGMDVCVNQHTYDNSVRIVREQGIKAEDVSL